MDFKSVFDKKISKERVFDKVVNKKSNALVLIPCITLVLLVMFIVFNKKDETVVYKNNIIVVNDLNSYKHNYLVYDVAFNKVEINSYSSLFSYLSKDYKLDRSYEIRDFSSNEVEAHQIIFKKDDKIIDIYYSEIEHIHGRPKCIIVPLNVLEKSIIKDHEVYFIRDYSDNYHDSISVRFNYEGLYYDIEIVNLSITEIVEILSVILK